jgi:AhpD family alkylhydroperoxidase
MDARFNYQGNTVAAKFAKYINSAGAVVSGSTLPAATQELVKIRASQINGCAACTDMHTKDAEHAGESSVRLNLVAVWREANVFTEAERAALELTEQGTRIADAAGGVCGRLGGTNAAGQSALAFLACQASAASS